MSDNETPISYDYDDNAAGHAEDFANRIDKSDAYIGTFTNAWALTSKTKEDGSGGTSGIHFEFEGAGGERGQADIYTVKKDGTKLFGYNMVMAMMLIMGVKGLKTKKGEIEVFDNDSGKRIKVEGDTFPDLMGKRIGVIFQKELYTKNDGKEGSRYNLIATFHPETKLTASEIKEKKVKPEKFDRIMRGLKTKDSRVAQAAEPAQPSQALPAGDY